MWLSLYLYNQLLFLFPRQLLDLPFAAYGLLFGGVGLVVDQCDGKAGAGIFGAFAAVVGSDAALDVCGPAGVEGAIAAADDDV